MNVIHVVFGAERSFAARRTHPDEHIDRWGAVYLANPQLRARGVLFETFLLAPAELLAACVTPVVTVTRCDLLPAQRAARLHADAEAALLELQERALAALAAEAHCANGTWTEKLRHHAHRARKGIKRQVIEVSP